MRESDQAALLEGSLELARSPGEWSSNGSYNYPKQYGSYWLLALALRLGGAANGAVGLEPVVALGNVVAVVFFGLALLAVVATQREWTWWTVTLFGCVLLSPVVAFTGVLLSTNVLSAACLLLLAVALRGLGWWTVPGCLVLSAAATACRQDAALLMPLLAFLSIKPSSLRAFLQSPRLWALAGGSLLAIALGVLIGTERKSLPEPFFVLPTFGAYLVFGLGGLVLAFLAFAWNLARSRQWGLTGLALAALLPLLFYSQFLYTPRHLFAPSVALLLTILLPRGVDAWGQVLANRSGRALLWGMTIATLLPWMVGVRVSGWTDGRVVIRHATMFPSTDGFWSLGAYASFYHRLAHASRTPVDHNQEVWAAWCDPELRLPPGKGAIKSSGLMSYASLAMAYHGVGKVETIGEADFVLFDDRTLSKVQLGVNLTRTSASREAQDLVMNGGSRVAGRGLGRRVVLWSGPGTERRLDEGVSLRLVLSDLYRGNDFRLSPWEESDWWRGFPWDGHRVVIASRKEEELLGFSRLLDPSVTPRSLRSAYDSRDWWVMVVRPDTLARFENQPSTDGIWIACSMLPKFMDVGSYAK